MAVVEMERMGHVALITLNRPEVRNALSPEVLCRLDEVWRDVAADDRVRVAVVTGKGKAFCSGADLARLIPLETGARQPEDDFDRRVLDEPGLGDRAILRHSELDKPVIAAVNGDAIAGGCEFVQGTDLRVAADGARLGVQEVRWGLFPMGGSSVRLPAQLPYAVAMEWLLTGGLVPAARAYELGFVNRVVPVERVLPEAMALADTIAANGPVAVRAIKASARACLGRPEAEALKLEVSYARPVFRTRDAVEGPRAFLEKRPPRFTGS